MRSISGTDRVVEKPDSALRGLAILEALSGMEQPAGLTSIAARTGLSDSQAYRALRALQHQGYVDHLGRSGYRLGSRSVALASLVGPRPALLRTAHPALARLAARTSQSAALHLRSGAHRVLVMAVQSPTQPLREVVVLGERAPLTSGCSGTVILAHLPPAELAEIRDSRPRKERLPSTAALARIREDGYALSFSANHVGVSGVAAPLLDPTDGYPLGSLAVAAPEAHLSEPALRNLSGDVLSACAELGPRLANMLGPNSTQRLRALDVTVQGILGS